MPRKRAGKPSLSLEQAQKTLSDIQSKLDDILKAAEEAVPALGEDLGRILSQHVSLLRETGRSGLERTRKEVAVVGRVVDRLIGDLAGLAGGLSSALRPQAAKAKRRSGRKPAGKGSRRSAPRRQAGTRGKGRAKPAGNQKPLAEALGEILKEGKGPMKAGALAEILTSKGYRSASQKFATVVQTRLSLDKRFKRDPKGGYRLA